MKAGFASQVTFKEPVFTLASAQGAATAKPVGGPSKRAFDIVLALSGLFIVLPLLVLLAILIWQHDGKSPFFGHRRVGRNGRPFKCWKFRSMRPDASEVLAAHLKASPEAAREWAETRKLRQDPRVTPIGRILRVSSLDELPQLFNVLAGHMSIVGPRPIVDDEINRYGSDVAYYLACRPGLTGLWQVSGRSDTSYADRVRFDTHYAENWSMWRDTQIVVRTVPVLLGRKGSY